MKINSIKVLVVFFALAGAAQAQRHQPPDPAQMVQHRVSFLTNKLGLSSSQQEQATTIFTNEISGGKSQHGQMRTAYQNLDAAVQKGDNAGIEQAAGTIGNLTSQMITAHSKAEAAFVQTLNPDQLKTYNDMHKGGWGGGMPGFHERRGPGGPGGPGGPAGPPSSF